MINRFTKREDKRRKAKERTGGGKLKREDRRRKAKERTGGGKPKREDRRRKAEEREWLTVVP